MSLSGHQSAKMKNDEWLTPPEIVSSLGDFDLDPCAPINRPWSTATLHYDINDDGLSQDWYGRVWMNPPFGREAIKWMRKLVKHGNGIALIPARTETAMFYETVWGKADGILFIKGRPHFHYVDGKRADFNSGAPICLVAYGQDNVIALIESGLGVVISDPVYCPQPTMPQPETNCPNLSPEAQAKLDQENKEAYSYYSKRYGWGGHDQVTRDEFDREAM